jgi:hypothetical protein
MQIKDKATGTKCWTWNNTPGREAKAEVKLRVCDNLAWQNWEWNAESGELVPAPDMAGPKKDQRLFRSHTNGNAQTIQRKRIPVAQRIARPAADRTIRPLDFLKNYCVTKKGRPQFRENVRLATIPCGRIGKKTQWYYHEATQQIRNWAWDETNGHWCWKSNPKTSGRRNYIRITRCRDVNSLDTDPVKAHTRFVWNKFTGEINPFRSRRFFVRFERKKKLMLVNKWRSGFAYQWGDVVPNVCSELNEADYRGFTSDHTFQAGWTSSNTNGTVFAGPADGAFQGVQWRNMLPYTTITIYVHTPIAAVPIATLDPWDLYENINFTYEYGADFSARDSNSNTIMAWRLDEDLDQSRLKLDYAARVFFNFAQC